MTTLSTATEPIRQFARDLRELRAAAGNPPYRDIARNTGYSPSTLSRAASGDRLPSLDVTRAYVLACGGDPACWEERWHGAYAALPPPAVAPPARGPAPAPVGLDEQLESVLAALLSGATDDAASRRLGMSVRTYKRRVAALLSRLGAGSRAQAGALAVRRGLG
jgi:transcriptional regulator with XRE-family HTH domain